MKLLNDLFEVLESSETEVGFISTIVLNPGHIVYAGHFPGHPVTPGVIQMQIVHELLEKHFCVDFKLDSMSQCKFLKILNPAETTRIFVHVEFNRVGNHLNVKARGTDGTGIFFKMISVYQFV